MTVIAAGFDGGMPKRRDDGTVLRREPQPPADAGRDPGRRPAAPGRSPPRSVRSRRHLPSVRPGPQGQPAQQGHAVQQGSRPSRQPAQQAEPAQPAPQPAAGQPRQVQFDDDDLDVPDFLK